MNVDRWRYILPLRLRALFRRTRVEVELDEELRDHLERQTQEFVRQGLSIGIGVEDPLTIVGATATLIVVAAVTACIPAHRARGSIP